MLKASVKVTLEVNVPDWFVKDSGDLDPKDIVYEWYSSGMLGIEGVAILDADAPQIEDEKS